MRRSSDSPGTGSDPASETRRQHQPDGLGGASPAWPAEIRGILANAVTTEFTSLTRGGAPITTPVTPYIGDTGLTLDVSTGLTYPAKAERARRNPRVCLLYADPVGTGLDSPPVVLVQGLATVRDRDLQANTDRYIRLSTAKLPAATRGSPKMALRRMPWYFARIWIEVTPTRILWWPGRDLATAPHEWRAPEGTVAPPSDPAPPGGQPGAWLAPPTEWDGVTRHALSEMSLRDLAVVDESSFPICLPVEVHDAVRERSGATDGRDDTRRRFRLELNRGAPPISDGPACLTFHEHPEVFTRQENLTLVGRTLSMDGDLCFDVERALAGWSLAGNRVTVALQFLGKGRKLAPRLRAEAARRGQPVPRVRFER